MSKPRTLIRIKDTTVNVYNVERFGSMIQARLVAIVPYYDRTEIKFESMLFFLYKDVAVFCIYNDATLSGDVQVVIKCGKEIK